MSASKTCQCLFLVGQSRNRASDRFPCPCRISAASPLLLCSIQTLFAMYYQFLLTVLPGFAAAHATFRASTANTRQVTPRADPPNPPEPPVEALVNFANGDGECNDEQKKTVRVEMAWARAMAQAAVDNTQHGGYFDHFFPEKLRKEKDFAAKIKDRFSRIADGTSNLRFVS